MDGLGVLVLICALLSLLICAPVVWWTWRWANRLASTRPLIGRFLKTFKYLSFASIGVLVLYIGIHAEMDLSGYCYKQRRFLTNQEKIEIAVKEIIRSYPPVVTANITINNGKSATRWFAPKNFIPYQSSDEFFKINKDCCEVTEHRKGDFWQKGEKLSLFEKLFGFTSSYIRIRYQVRYFDENGKLTINYVEPYIAISSCGKIIH